MFRSLGGAHSGEDVRVCLVCCNAVLTCGYNNGSEEHTAFIFGDDLLLSKL
jgi:hypothetical protein